MLGDTISAPRTVKSSNEELKDVKSNLEKARIEKDPVLLEELCTKVEDALSRINQAARRVLIPPRSTEDQLLCKEISSAFNEYGKILQTLGKGDSAQHNFSLAQKWTHAHDSSEKSGIKRGLRRKDVAQVPSNIFYHNVTRPMVKYNLPELQGHLESTPQLAYCLSLLSKDISSITTDTQLDEAQLNWILSRANDPEESERLNLLSQEILKRSLKDERMDPATISEVIHLAPVLNREDHRKLLNKSVSDIDHSTLLYINQLEGLAQQIQCARPGYLRADDLVKILKPLNKHLHDIHQQSIDHQQPTDHLYQLTLVVSRALDAMANSDVKGLKREHFHAFLSDYVTGLIGNSDPYLVYQAAYAHQALQYIPNYDTPWKALIGRTKLVADISEAASAAINLDLYQLIDALEHIQDEVNEVHHNVVRFENISSPTESNQAFLDSLKEAFLANQKRLWYPTLRSADALLRNGQLSDFKKLVCSAPCRRDPAFEWGLCQMLAEIAINPLWRLDIRKNAIDFLAEIYKNDADWDQQINVKQWILINLFQISESQDDIKEHFDSLSCELEKNGSTKKQDIYNDIKNRPPSLYPLKLSLLPPLATSSILERVQDIPKIDGLLQRLKVDQLGYERDTIYVPLHAKRNLTSKESFSLMEDVQEFLKSDKKVFLLLGDSASGKSTFNRVLVADLWESYNSMERKFPLFVFLPLVDKPENEMIAKQLRSLRFTEEHIQELKQNYEIILICDGFDETQSTANLYVSNRLNQAGEWRAQMVISCRAEYIGQDYRDLFQPFDRNTIGSSVLLQEAVIMPFNKDQVQDYFEQYASLYNSERWGHKDYKQVLEQVPALHDLTKNPFLLKLIMEALPRLVDVKEEITSQKITRTALFDLFVKQWLERNRMRLMQVDMTEADAEVFRNLCRSGFTNRGVNFIRDLAKAIYIENEGKPVFTYSRERDQESWQAAFFNENDGSHLLMQAIPLIRHENQYRFINKSILEYGLSLSIFNPNTIRQDEESVSAQSRRGSTSSALSFETEDSEEDSVTPIEQSLIESPFGIKYFINEPSITQFLVERVQQQLIFKDQLHAAIEQSKTDTKARIAAANAITVLIRAGVQFSGSDLRDIKVPRADLSFGVFDSAQLQGADLRKTNLRNVWLRQANLEGARMDGAQFGELPFLQEDDEVCCCAYSPDGNIFAVGLKTGLISLYETSTWRRTQRLTGHDGGVTSLSFSTTNDRIASGSHDSTVRLWDVDTGECTYTLQGHSRDVTRVVYSPKGDRIASGSHDSTVRLWDFDTGECIHTLQGHSHWVTSVVYSPKGDRIASGSHDSTVRLWDVDTGECIHTLQGHSDRVTGVVYSPKGDRIASGSHDSTVRLWDVDTGECIHTLQGHSHWVTSVVYSPKGDQIASGSNDKTVRLWDVDTGECVHTLQGHSDRVTSVVYSPRGDRVASGSYDKTMRLWDVDTGECLHILWGHIRDVTSVVYSPRGDRVASGSSDKTVRLWDVDTVAGVYISQNHSGAVNSVVYSPRENQVASGSADETVRLWDVDTGECRHVLRGHNGYVACAVYSPKGDRIASGSSDSTVRLWDVDTGECIHTLQGHTNTVTSVVYSPKGDRIASGGWDKTVRLWDVDTGECIHTLQGHSDRVTSVVYSPKGDRIASGSSDKTVRIWDVDTGECVHTLQGHSEYVTSVVHSPKGDRIASGGADKTVRLWDVSTGECIHTLQGHRGYVTCAVYSPRGDWIASGSADGTVRVWDVDTGECIHILQGHSDYVICAVYSPKGDRIASGSSDRTVRLWNLETGYCEATISDFNGPVSSLALRSDSGSLFLVTGSEDRSLRHWRITKEGDEHKSTLCWSTSHEVLTATDVSFKDVQGLSPMNQKLVIQHGALI